MFEFAVLLILLSKSIGVFVFDLADLINQCLHLSLMLLFILHNSQLELLYFKFFLSEIDHYPIVLCSQYLAFLFELIHVLSSVVLLRFELHILLLQLVIQTILDKQLLILVIRIFSPLCLTLF